MGVVLPNLLDVFDGWTVSQQGYYYPTIPKKPRTMDWSTYNLNEDLQTRRALRMYPPGVKLSEVDDAVGWTAPTNVKHWRVVYCDEPMLHDTRFTILGEADNPTSALVAAHLKGWKP